MRPICRGAAPREYRRYRDAVDDLTHRLGYFCSYCEQVIKHVPEVEHVQPKVRRPELERSWDNFLLSCKSCNTVKSSSLVDIDAVAWPDRDNTFSALIYRPDGSLEIRGGLPDEVSELVENAVKLVKLHRHPNGATLEDRPSPRDKRSEHRFTAYAAAEKQLINYERCCGNPEVREVISDMIANFIAPSLGFFSVWMSVFLDHPEMRIKFIEAFPGTARDCFNGVGVPVRRPGGRF
ncbi:HNH endonuclease [Mangrovicoccus algicola]|uniref:HNH endonuclease n=1 Tax=Mangrovicoccus algicola TaxID=2771008 RepID=A0A8J6Z2L7_9RHOB|nr:HNH endonuclease [Mangrovicoccus algicola]MBE3640521.1 HNH endonuclease [Mangrovicoccus algicola]